MALPLVTIIIPVGPGHTSYLPLALASLAAQTVDCWACLVVNDSGEVLDVPALETEGRQGPAVARNLGLEAVETPFVFFLDADDELPPDALEILIRAYASYQEAGYVYGDYTLLREGQPPSPQVCALYMRPALAHGSLHPVSFLLPTRAAREVGGFNPSLESFEDWEFCIKLAVQGWCGVRVPHPTLRYREHSGQRRNAGYARGQELVERIAGPYRARLTGEELLMGCGCSDQGARVKAQRLVATWPQIAEGVVANADGVVRMEFVGANTGSRAFSTDPLTNRPFTKVYRGANNAHYRYTNAAPEDVAGLEALGLFRRVVIAAPPLPTLGQDAPVTPTAPVVPAVAPPPAPDVPEQPAPANQPTAAPRRPPVLRRQRGVA